MLCYVVVMPMHAASAGNNVVSRAFAFRSVARARSDRLEVLPAAQTQTTADAMACDAMRSHLLLLAATRLSDVMTFIRFLKGATKVVRVSTKANHRARCVMCEKREKRAPLLAVALGATFDII